MILGVLVCMSIPPALADSKPDLICHSSNPKECYPRVFQPTDEFQIVHDDQELPKGLHVRLNIWTGKKEAKFNVPGEGDPALEGLPVDQAIVVVEPQQPDAPRVPKGAPEYEPVGKVKEPSQHESESFSSIMKALGSGVKPDNHVFDEALEALEELSHDIYYGLKIAEDMDVVKALFCLMADQKAPGSEGFTPRDQQAASILASALQNNPPALEQVAKVWPKLVDHKCPGNDKILRETLYSSFIPASNVDPAGAKLSASRVKAKVSTINGLIKGGSIRSEFLNNGGMEGLLKILVPEEKEWAGAQRKVGQLVLDNFLDEDMGAELEQWPKVPKLSDERNKAMLVFDCGAVIAVARSTKICLLHVNLNAPPTTSISTISNTTSPTSLLSSPAMSPPSPPPQTPPTLQIRAHATKGRALHATQRFAPGATIHAFTHPTLLLPSLTHLALVCSYCLRPGDPRACSRCRAAYYCDAACQGAAWRAVHARECKALRQRRLGGRPGAELPTPVRALLQALLVSEVGGVLHGLEGHARRRRADGGAVWRDLEMMGMAGCAFAGRPAGEDEVRSAVELLCKIQTNAFHRYDADLGQVGIFLEPTLAMANHSCVPNAMVQFVGRTAVLRAERPIDAGEEIKISYTDYTYPLSKRKEALSPYCFECSCPRCKDNLNVYEVCAASRGITPPGLGLEPASPKAQDHPAVADPTKQALAKASGESATRSTEARASPESLPERRNRLLSQYRDRRDLISGELWAVTPVPQVLTEISILYAEEGSFPFALAMACLVATKCDPYRYMAHFHPARAKNIFMIAKLLANTAEGTAALSNSVKSVASKANLVQQAQELLQGIDQVSLCQMLLITVLRSAPVGHAAEWELAVAAREILRDIGQLPGRDKELSLIESWIQDPASDQSKAFFDYAVLQQVDALASLGQAVLKVDFDASA
ncbi:Histone-lysine N-methyltransferase SMYD3 [Tolypocladium capitatum]|uniref:Nucleotide exchange factor SIL1 n=1 Tax=Tolypocladium capitatum TaxID=45235 RepID=A0A2K3QBA5_9HYPO|nr:Histone-lysine N-methyltransferase SMYD3 [Tolypocladium capitatum]